VLSLILSFCLPLYSIAAPVNLLALTPTQETGTVTREEAGTANLRAGMFGVAAIYHKLGYSGKSYDLKASFTRQRGSDGVGFVIPVGDKKVTVVFGGWGGRYDGLNRVNGFDPSSNQNPTRRSSKLVNGDELEILISVRPGKITVNANGKPHIELDTNAHKLSLVDDIQKRFQDGLGIYIVNGGLELSAWSIEEKL